jgi:phosphoribosylanthranilate isomerase
VTLVKICGITRVEDALLAADAGAFAIGVVFWKGSPRYVTPSRAREITEALPDHVEAVGVFVDQAAAEIEAVAREVGLDRVQLHGSERVADYKIGTPLIKAVPVRDSRSAAEALELPASVLVLLDAHDPVKRGGTGRTIDWTLASGIAAVREVALSGGLHAGNIAEAIRVVRPSVVDVSSGVETSPGRKDPAKLRALFAAVRAS